MIELMVQLYLICCKKSNSFKQGDLPIFEYYHKLNSLWREFDILTKLPDCVYAARAELGDHGKLMKLMQFLMDLDDVYQPIRSSLLTREVLTEVKDAFVFLAREESHRGIPATAAKSDKPQASVFISRVNDNCGLRGHTVERCFEIIGYPPGFKRNHNMKVNGTFNNNKSNNADLKGKSVKTNDLKTTADTLSFTHEQVVKLMNLLNDKSGSTAHANMAGVSYHFRWIIDSGANQHMTTSIKNMIYVVDVNDLNLTVGHPNGTLTKITHIGNLRLNNIILFDVLIIPEYCVSLLFDLKRETILGTGSESAGLYLFDVDCDKIAVSNQSKYFVCYVSKDVWHNRLGHPANQVLKLLKNSLNFSNNDHNSPCAVCHKAKPTRVAFPLSDHKSICLGEHIHLDVWGPYRVVSKEGFKYFLTIVDDFNRSDNRTEFVNSKMTECFNSIVYGREPNLSHLRSFDSLCFAAIVKGSDKFSGRSKKCVLIRYASGKKAYKLFSFESRNVLYSRDVKFYEIVFHFKMNNNHMSLNEHTYISTLYLFDQYESNLTNKTPIRPNDDEEDSPSRDGRAHQPVNGSETEQPGHDGSSSATPLDEIDISEGNVSLNDVPGFQNNLPSNTEEGGPRRSQRTSKFPAKLNEFVLDTKVKYGLNKYANHSFLKPENYNFVSNLNKGHEPSSYEEAMNDINWINAMNEEMNALYENKTWDITDLPLNRKPIGCKWVYRIKYKSNGEVERYKARLVAKGFGQKEMIDYEETFSPVVKMITVRCLINLVIQKDRKSYQMDVNNGFLYGDLNEEVYMVPPLGLIMTPLPENIVLSHKESDSDKYVVPTSRVVVPTSRYVVPVDKVIIIVSP
ncbi:ribonuclease H-like domain-containing protein, partial [Tanacetum coccineum]